MARRLPTLKHRAEFVKIAREGAARSTPGLVLQMRRRSTEEAVLNEADPIRIGITASRKVGNAVARNRVRRRLRALAEQVLATAGEPGCDYVLIGRSVTASRPYPQLIDDLKAALARLARERRR